MPVFTIPIHEHGDPTRSGPYPHGTGTARVPRVMPAVGDPQVVRPGQTFDIVAAALAGATASGRATRLFMYNPKTRELALGGSGDFRDFSHGELAKAVFGAQSDKYYDQFPVHGYLEARLGRFSEIRVSRVLLDAGYEHDEMSQFAKRGAVGGLVKRLVQLGAPRYTHLRAYDVPGWDTPMRLDERFPQRFGRRAREANDCHLPGGRPDGGQFCSRSGFSGLGVYPFAKGSQPIPDYLKPDVLRARQAGIEVFHAQQPEPVEDTHGNIHDPLAKSHAQRGESRFADEQYRMHLAPRGRIYITTRGGPFEPEREVWDDKFGFSSRRERKALTPETPFEKATPEDVISTFRHEMGHIFDKKFGGGKSTPMELAREIRAWQYALEISPDHAISTNMARRGLLSHAYHAFRSETLITEWEQNFGRVNSWDRAETAERLLKDDLRKGAIDLAARRKAEQFTNRVIRSLTNYGKVLRKRGLVREPDPWAQGHIWAKYRRYPLPGPGRGSGRFI